MGSRARNVYCKRFLDLGLGIPVGGRGRRNFAATDARNFTQPVYRRLTLAHDPEKACPGLDPGWEPVFGKDHAQKIEVLAAATFNCHRSVTRMRYPEPACVVCCVSRNPLFCDPV